MHRLLPIIALLFHGCGVVHAVSAQSQSRSTLPHTQENVDSNKPNLLAESVATTDWNAAQVKTLYRVSEQGLRPAELLALATLQGLLAKRPSNDLAGEDLAGGNVVGGNIAGEDVVGGKAATENLFFDPGSGGYDLWLNIAQHEFGVELKTAANPWEILERFASVPAGYLLCDLDDERSVNLATSLAGPSNGIVVDVSIERRAMELGWKRLADARSHNSASDDRTIAANRSAPVVILQRKSLLWQLKDLAVLTNTSVLSSSQPYAYHQQLNSLGDMPAIVFGWGDNQLEDEDEFIGQVSRAGGSLIPADHVRNLSVLAGLRDKRVLEQQSPISKRGVNGKKVHTVTFVFTDGDNLGWLLNDFPTDPRWFGSKERGQVALGWGMSPMLAAMFPAAVDWYFRNASKTSAAPDVFIAGPSGSGYCFPSLLPTKALREHGRLTAKLMQNADLGILQVIDKNALDRIDLWDTLTRQDAIDGIIYLDYSAYDKERGRMVWSNGKPVVSASARFWQGQPGSDTQALVRKLSTAPRRTDVPEGYSVVMVHAWSQSVASVVDLVEQLPSEVEVLAPDEFFRRISDNIKPPT